MRSLVIVALALRSKIMPRPTGDADEKTDTYAPASADGAGILRQMREAAQSALLEFLLGRRALSSPSLSELPDRHAGRYTGCVPIAAHIAEQDPVRLDADRLMPTGDHHPALVDAQRAVLGVDAEDLRRGPPQALRPRHRSAW